MRRLEASAISMQRERMLGGGVINERIESTRKETSNISKGGIKK